MKNPLRYFAPLVERDSKISRHQLMHFVGFSLVSVLLARNYWNHPLPYDVMLVYLSIASGGAVASKWLDNKQVQPEVQPQPQEKETQ